VFFDLERDRGRPRSNQTPKTAQPTPETDEKKPRGLWSYAVWAFVAVMVYVLSSGPAWRLQSNGFILGTPKLNSTVYAPINWVYPNTMLHKPLGMYCHFWWPVAFGPDGTAAIFN
jgi:hypothetical protein